jgi:uncharacterized protein (DUF305 family)
MRGTPGTGDGAEHVAHDRNPRDSTGVTAPLGPEHASNDADLHYLRGALSALSDALEASGVAATEASHPSVRALAGRTAATQGDDIRTVAALLDGSSDHQGAPDQTAETAPVNPRSSAANELRSRSGLEVDLRFLEILTAHTHGVLASTRTEMIEGFAGSSRGHAEAASRRCWQELNTLGRMQVELARHART